ncbi:hypothetical protein P3S67_010515 [Capsicum chacoense]
MKNIQEPVSESDSELKKISDYVESSKDVAKRSVSGDSEESEGSERNSDSGDNDPLSMLSLSRCISVERSRMDSYQEFKQVLVDQELKKGFKWSCFGHIKNLSEYLKFNRKLIYYLLLRHINNAKIHHEMWFYIKNKSAYFGLKEFCLITRLNFSSLTHELKMNKVLAKGDNFCFKFLHTMLLAKDSTKVVDTKLIRMVDFEFIREVSVGKKKFQLTMDYLKKKSDLKKQREVFDEKEKSFYALFGFSWAFMIWIYEPFPHLGEFAGKLMDEPFPISRILRWHTTKSDKIIEGDPFKYKEKVTENVYLYIIPTIRETKVDYVIMFEPSMDEVKDNILDGLKKELERVTVLTSNEDNDDDGDLGGNPVGVRVGDDDSPSTSNDVAGTSTPGIFISVFLCSRKQCWILLPISERKY